MFKIVSLSTMALSLSLVSCGGIDEQDEKTQAVAVEAGKGVVNFVNVNDGSVEGVQYPERRCFTVQFHPEACAGPIDTGFLFDRFLALIGGDD